MNGSVAIAWRSHPIPFRTRTWNFTAPMVLQLKLRKSRSLPNLLYTLRYASYLSFPFLPPISLLLWAASSLRLFLFFLPSLSRDFLPPEIYYPTFIFCNILPYAIPPIPPLIDGLLLSIPSSWNNLNMMLDVCALSSFQTLVSSTTISHF